ncbi:MAG: D-alanyl-D-alanine carboxypeptidase, partial [Oscillospiraceae bacterium]|nr:D-alanyl-D-alanine carboxypeptidase [Oscillospiraceae bacterium]
MYVIKKTKKKLISLMLAAALVAVCAIQAGAAPIGSSAAALNVPARAAILIEKETGTVIYEKDADTKREPASVTKIMTILLIVEALDSGSLTLDDIVTTSAHAQSMGGSQIYLSEGERMSVHEMLKAIVVASANDAATAMAEHLAGSEPVFAERMNERARQLGMTNTHFTNASGLLDDTTHVTTARDVSLMARELIGHNFIKQYTTIW